MNDANAKRFLRPRRSSSCTLRFRAEGASAGQRTPRSWTPIASIVPARGLAWASAWHPRCRRKDAKYGSMYERIIHRESRDIAMPTPERRSLARSRSLARRMLPTTPRPPGTTTAQELPIAATARGRTAFSTFGLGFTAGSLAECGQFAVRAYNFWQKMGRFCHIPRCRPARASVKLRRVAGGKTPANWFGVFTPVSLRLGQIAIVSRPRSLRI